MDNQKTSESMTMEYCTISRKVSGWKKALWGVDEVKDIAWCHALVLVGLHDTSFAALQAQDAKLVWGGWQCRALLLELLRMFDNCLDLGESAAMDGLEPRRFIVARFIVAPVFGGGVSVFSGRCGRCGRCGSGGRFGRFGRCGKEPPETPTQWICFRRL